MAMDRIAYIKEHYNVLDYAKDVLGLPVQKSGDRCKSFTPGEHKTNNAFVAYEDWWYDFSAGIGGDVIDLCALAKYDGNKGEAIRELAGSYGCNPEWIDYTHELNAKIAYWHSQLRESDWRYLYRRGIKKATVDRLMLGFNETENRLIIPYFKNGYIAYYIGRDRSDDINASKYKKAYLNGLNENIPWGLHSFTPKNRQRVEEELSAKNDAEVEKNDTASMSKIDVCMTGENIQTSDTISKKRNFTDKMKLINEYVVIAEGAFDAMSFEQEGFKVLSPISGYFSKEALKQVLKLLKSAKCVFVCFDSDKAGSRFTQDFCKILFKNRIKFVCGILPEGVKDVSDYYAAGGDLFTLVEEAKSGLQILAGRITDKEEFRTFIYETARFASEEDVIELMENVTQFSEKWLKVVLKNALKCPPETQIIKEIREKYFLKYIEKIGFYEYLHGVWIKRSDNLISGYLSELLGRYATGSKLNSMQKLLQAETTSEEVFNRKPLFNFQNCVLELETGKTREANPGDLSSIQMKYDYDAEAKCPRWEKFISEIMANREASMKLLQEMAGYILFTDCSLQKAFFLIGDGANGKSVLLNVLSAVFSEENISNIEMSTLDNEFQRINLLNSLANISTDTGTKIEEASAYFKQIVAGDPINGCYKGKDQVKFKPRCVMISACNEYIRTKDTTTGFLRRICFIDFPCKFEGEKADINLESKLKEELSGIFNWCYEGYKRLKVQKKFTETVEQAELMDEFVKVSNPVAVFIEEEMATEHGQVDRSELYRRYQAWTKEAGHEAQSRYKFIQTFKRVVKQKMPQVVEKTVHGYPCFDFSNTFKEFKRYE